MPAPTTLVCGSIETGRNRLAPQTTTRPVTLRLRALTGSVLLHRTNSSVGTVCDTRGLLAVAIETGRSTHPRTKGHKVRFERIRPSDSGESDQAADSRESADQLQLQAIRSQVSAVAVETGRGEPHPQKILNTNRSTVAIETGRKQKYCSHRSTIAIETGRITFGLRSQSKLAASSWMCPHVYGRNRNWP